MICLKVDIPKEVNDIADELKAIYHSRDTVCFVILKTRNERNTKNSGFAISKHKS